MLHKGVDMKVSGFGTAVLDECGAVMIYCGLVVLNIDYK